MPATTACSAPVTIAQAPILRFQAPSPTSGADYATTELGNAWDMSDTADIGNWDAPFEQRWWNNPTLSGGIFRATAVAPGRSSAWSDATILASGPSDVPIDTRRPAKGR